MNPGPNSEAAPPRTSLFRLFVLNFGSEALGQVIAFAIGAYLARVLSAEAFAAWVFATAVLGFLAVLVDGGAEVWGGREVGADPRALRPSVLAVLRQRALLACVAAAALLAVAFTSSPLQSSALLFGGGSLVALTLQTAWAHRALHSAAPAAAILFQRLAMLVVVLLTVRQPEQVARVTFWQGVTDLLAALVLLAALLPALRRGGDRQAPAIDVVARETAPLGASRLLRNLPTTFSALLLGYLMPSADLGDFGAAQRLAMLLLIVSAVFNLVTFPVIARASAVGGDGEVKVIVSTLRLLTLLIAPICVGGVLLAEPLLRLAFTSDYASAAPALQMLFVAYGVQSLSDNLRRVLHARRQVRSDLIRVGLATAATFAVGGLAVPAFSTIGAAATVAIGEFIMLGLAFQALRLSLDARMVWGIVRAPAGYALAMGVVVLFLRASPVHLPIAAGAAIYLLLTWFSRGLIRADLQALELVAGGPTKAWAATDA